MKITAFCYASGLIGFTTPVRCPKVPEGALPIITGPAKKVRKIIEACARHSYKAKKGQHTRFLVPGIPEAELMGYDPAEMLIKFRAWTAKRLNEERRAA